MADSFFFRSEREVSAFENFNRIIGNFNRASPDIKKLTRYLKKSIRQSEKSFILLQPWAKKEREHLDEIVQQVSAQKRGWA